MAIPRSRGKKGSVGETKLGSDGAVNSAGIVAFLFIVHVDPFIKQPMDTPGPSCTNE